MLKGTPNKQTLTTIMEDEDKFRLAFEHAAICFCLLDQEGNIIELNKSMCTLLGATEEELLCCRLSDFIHPDDLEDQIQQMENLLSGEIKAFQIENRYLRKDGTTVWVRKNFSTVQHKDGTIKYLINLTDDISDHQNAVQELKDSENKFKALYNNSPDAYLICDLQDMGRIKDCNAAAEKLLRGCKEQIIGKTPLDLSPEFQPDGTPSIASIKKNSALLAASPGTEIILEHVHQRLDGTEFWTAISVSSILFQDKPHGLVVWRDISKQKEAEYTLTQSENKFRLLYDNSPDAYFICDLENNGTILDCNLSAEILLKGSKEQIIGRTLMNFTPDFQPNNSLSSKSFQDNIKLLLSDSEAKIDFERLQYRLDFEPFWAHISVSTIEHEGKRQALAVWRDIDKRKKLELSIKQSEYKFRKVFDVAPLGFLVMNLEKEGTILDCNTQVEKILGISKDKILGKTPLFFSPIRQPDGQFSIEVLKSHIREMLIQPQQNYSCEYVHRRANGQNFWAAISIAPLTLNDESLVFVTWKDISDDKLTAKREAEYQRQLEAEVVKNRVLLDTSRNGIILLDTKGNLVEASPSVYEKLGYSPSEMLSMHICDWDLIKQDRLESLLSELDEHMPSIIFETQYRCKDGGLLDVEVTAKGISFHDKKYIYASTRNITESKAAQQKILQYQKELQLESRRNKLLLQTAADCIHHLDLQGTVVSCSDSFAHALGYTPQEVIGMNYKQWDYSIDKNEAHKILSRFKEDVPAVTFETIHRRKDGSEFPVEVILQGVTIGNDRLIYGSARDISDYKLAQQKIESYQKKLENEARRNKLLLQKATDGIYHTTLDGIVVQTSNSFAGMLGYTTDELIGMSVFKFNVLDSEELIEEWKKILIPDAPPLVIEIKQIRKDGTLFDAEVTAQVVVIDQEQLVYVSSRDISDRKKNQLALQKYQKELETESRRNYLLLKTASNGMHHIDLQGNLVQSSDSFAQMLGYTTQEVLQLKVWDWAAGATKDMVLSKLKMDSENKKSTTFEDTFMRKDGTQFLAETTFVPVDIDGQIIMYASSSDITERKLAQEKILAYQQELEAIKAELEDRVIRRTQELHLKERQLQEQNRELKKTNEELDRFVYSASHDLRAPLASISGLLSIMEMQPGNDTANLSKHLQMMKDMVLKLDSFIDDILEYSRNMRTEVAADSIDFAHIYKETMDNLSYMDGLQHCTLEEHIYQQGAFVSDAKRLGIVLSNLLSNAIKYRDPAKTDSYVKINIKSYENDAFIEIEDNGLGIADNHREKIFDMFYRATKASTGSGIGLYIVKETIEKIGGSILVESELKKGSRFIIQIPNLNIQANEN